MSAAQSTSDPGHQRRISRLDDLGKFQASLEAVRVDRSSRSGSMVEPDQQEPAADVVQEAAEGEEEEELK